MCPNGWEGVADFGRDVTEKSLQPSSTFRLNATEALHHFTAGPFTLLFRQIELRPVRKIGARFFPPAITARVDTGRKRVRFALALSLWKSLCGGVARTTNGRCQARFRRFCHGGSCLTSVSPTRLVGRLILSSTAKRPD
jgi:hypothetical protein